MLWCEQSWPAIDQIDRDTPVVVPLGSCEQHGHHLPVFVDSIQVQTIADGVHERLADRMLLLPTLWLGSSHHHLDYPGTISVCPTLYTQMIQDVARSIIGAGFRRIMFLNGHGGNETPGAQALTELVATDDVADDCLLALSSWWTVARESIRADHHGMTTVTLSHACEYETSLMLCMREDLVDMGAIVSREPVDHSPWFHSDALDNRASVFHRYHRFTGPGHMGAPQEATAAKGESLLAAVVEDVATFLEYFATCPPMKAQGPR